MRKALNVALALALLAASNVALASGFKINEQDAKAGGMANAFAAQADDPGTIGLNLAGIGQLEGIQASIGTSEIYVPGRDFRTSIPAQLQDESADSQLFTVPTFYVTSDLGMCGCGMDRVHLGLGVYSVFGLTQDWDATGMTNTRLGNPDGFAEVVKRAQLKTVFVNPVLGYEVVPDHVTVAAGFIAGFADLEESADPLITRTGFKLADLEQDVRGWDWSFNVGMHARMGPMRFGAYYRHKLDLDLAGHFTAVGQSPLVFGPGVLPFGTHERVRFNLPATVAGGIAWDVCKRLTVELDAEYNFWSQFDEVDVRLDNPLVSANNATVISSGSLSRTPDWNDSWAFRGGFQYRLTHHLALRAGGFFDQTPIPLESLEPAVPDGSRWGLTLGAGYSVCHWSVDLAYQAVYVRDRQVNNTALAGSGIAQQFGEYSSDPVHVFMITLGVKF